MMGKRRESERGKGKFFRCTIRFYTSEWFNPIQLAILSSTFAELINALARVSQQLSRSYKSTIMP
jgi:hypothetical protein